MSLLNIQSNISLRPYHTFHINVVAKKFATFSNVDELNELLQSSTNEKNRLILGGGSNILFTKNYDGIILRNEIKGIDVVKEDADHVYIRVGAGENWHQFVLHSINKELGGVENLSLIPGNVGASPMQNIGAYGVEIKEVFETLTAFHLNDRKIVQFSLNDCQFGYRDSVFKNKYKDQFVILDVIYRLNKFPKFNTSYGAIEEELQRMQVKELSIKAISQAVINIRSSKLPDPDQIGNAGSFFKNPTIASGQFAELKISHPTIPSYPVNPSLVKVPAAWLIDQCGWKGYRKGDAGCHAKQALVLVNYGTASGNEIYDLSEEILQTVQKKFGIILEREVNIV